MSLIDSRSHTLVGSSAHRASRAVFNDPSGSDTSGIRTPRTYGLALTGEVKNYGDVTLHEHVCDFNDIEAHFSGFFLYDGGVGIEYRRAKLDDVDGIAALHADSWRRNYRGAYSDS